MRRPSPERAAKAELRRQIIAAARVKGPPSNFPITDPSFKKCSRAIHTLADTRGQFLSLPFQALPPLP